MIEQILNKAISEGLCALYGADIQHIQYQKTRKEFDGDITLVVFPLLKLSKKDATQTAEEIGNYLQENVEEVYSYNVVKGFLNLSIDDSYWMTRFVLACKTPNYGILNIEKDAPTYLVEYSSPNTNKPLHLGHIRNNLLGYSVAEIIKASGKNVKKVQIINDKGIHICKSMVAWQDFGNGETPGDRGIKGDHLVGKYYVKFEKSYKAEITDLVTNGVDREQAKKQAPILLKAQEMLIKWEAKDPEIIKLWKMMNGWVYDGFEETYRRLGVDFDKNYYESETYLLGKEVVQKGIEKGIFYKKEDNSVWIDLSKEGLDQKILLRSDGTTVYITQDIGTIIQRHQDFRFSNIAYTVGNEQDYHFKVLFLILNKLGYDWAKDCYHLSYGMVDLPLGKMKSREGTIVDADALIDEMVETARSIAKKLGKLDGMSKQDARNLYEIVGLGALKYFILKVDPKKRILFDPEESIDFNGNTGAFIQYTYARIQSVIRQYQKKSNLNIEIKINKSEHEIIKLITEFPKIIQEAAKSYSPALIANYIYDLVKEFNAYYQNTRILTAEKDYLITFRVKLSKKVGEIIKTGMGLLGVEVPNKM